VCGGTTDCGRGYGPTSTRRIPRTLTVGYLVFLVIAVVSWVGLDQIVSRFAEMDLTSINERPAIWADTIRIAKDFWLPVSTCVKLIAITCS